MSHTALVIGAGIGGISTAARLARGGYKVTVLEKNSIPGGRCGQINRDGHRFDVGATLFLMPELFAQTYRALGERMENHLDLRRIDPTYRIRFDDGVQLALTGDLPSLQAQLEAIEPGSFDGFLNYLAEGYTNYRVSVESFVGRNFYSLLEYFTVKNLLLMFKVKALLKQYNSVSHYFRDPHLRAAFTFQCMYLGLSPYDAPATYSLLQYTELAEGVWFPIGGLYRVIESLVSIAEANGVQFLYNKGVKQIQVEGNRANGVILEDGTFMHADLVVANADLPYVYRDLLPDDGTTAQLERKKYTCSAIMFYWGVDKVYPQLDHHNVFLSGDYQGSFERIFHAHTLPEKPSLYVHAPARTDSAAAPQGQDTLFVLVPVGHLDAATPQDWEALKAKARAATLKRLETIGITDLEAHLKFEMTCMPQDWESRYNLAKGATFGLGHSIWQVGYFRPHNRHRRYRNLYFVGSSTHPGAGVPMALLSSRLTTERIFKEMGAAQSVFHPMPTV